MSIKKIFGQITKSEEQDDGTIIVEGYASAATVDSDGETITSEAMKAALPDYMKIANIREMHQLKAAGVALSATVEDDGRTKLCAHIVDAEAVKKVRAGVYKGFSIGGTVTGRDEVSKTTITGLRLSEISLVDRPANPDAVITCFKADGAGVEAEAVEPAPKVADEQVAKGGYEVGRIADLAEDVANLSSYLDYIADNYEEAPLDVIAQCKASAASLYDAMAGLAVFEAERMKTILSAEKAAKADDLAKAGSRNSKSDQTILNQALALLKQLGAAEADESDESEKAATTDTLAKAESLQKMFDEAKAKNESLTKRVKELEAQPEPPKASLLAVTKAEDVGADIVPTVEAVKKSDGSIDETATAIKKAFANPMRLM